MDPPKTQNDDTVVVLLQDTDVLNPCKTLADYGLPNGDAEVSVVVKFDDQPAELVESSEDSEKDEAAAAASSASETESSSEGDFDDLMSRLMFRWVMRQQQQQRP